MMIILCLPNAFTSFFFFSDPATTEIYTLSLHDALPISGALLHDHLVQCPLRLEGGAFHLAEDRQTLLDAGRAFEHALQDRRRLLGLDLGEEPHPADLHPEHRDVDARGHVGRTQERAVPADRDD